MKEMTLMVLAAGLLFAYLVSVQRAQHRCGALRQRRGAELLVLAKQHIAYPRFIRSVLFYHIPPPRATAKAHGQTVRSVYVLCCFLCFEADVNG